MRSLEWRPLTARLVAWDAWRAKRGGLATIAARQQARLQALVAGLPVLTPSATVQSAAKKKPKQKVSRLTSWKRMRMARPGVRKWFDGLPKVENGGPAAAFDTRLESLMAGGAARGIPARRLRGPGYDVVGDRRASSWRTRMGPFAPASSSERSRGGLSW